MDAGQFRTTDLVADGEEHNRARLLRSTNRLSRKYLTTVGTTWLIQAISGVIIGSIAVLLTIASGWLSDLREGHCSTFWYLNESTCCMQQSGETCAAWIKHPWFIAWLFYVVISVIFATAASAIVTSLAPLAAGSGISEIKCIISGFSAPQFLDKLVLFVKCITLPLTIASGLSVGKEGPSVHYSACVGHLVSSFFGPLDYKKRTDLITACCAAGVAVAFGSPIGGVLFGLEEMAAEISLNTIWRSYFCCLIATSVVSILNPFRTGQLVLFSVRYDTSWNAFDLPFFLILGIAAGLASHLVVKYNLRITALRKKFWGAQHFLLEAAFLALLTALISYFNPYLKMDMTKSMQVLFHECEHGGELHASCDASNKVGVMLSLAFACIARLLLLLITYGAAKVPAGIFVPSLAIGALFGRFVGTFVWMLYDRFPNSWYFKACSNLEEGALCVNPGSYALLGAGALLSGVMHISLTVVIVMFELTGALHYVVPTMIVVGMTRFVTSQLGGGGIADMAIKQNRLPFLEREPHILDFQDSKVTSLMIPLSDCKCDRAGEEPSVAAAKYTDHPLLDAEDHLLASVNKTRVNRSPIVIDVSDSLEKAYMIFARLGPHTIYIIENGKLAGLITRKMMSELHNKGNLDFTPTEARIGSKILEICELVSSKLQTLWSAFSRRRA